MWGRAKRSKPSPKPLPSSGLVVVPAPAGVPGDGIPGPEGHNRDSPTDKGTEMPPRTRKTDETVNHADSASSDYPFPGVAGDTSYAANGKVKPETAYLNTAPVPGDMEQK